MSTMILFVMFIGRIKSKILIPLNYILFGGLKQYFVPKF